MVERKSGYAVNAKVAHKTSELVNQAIIEGIGPYARRVKRSPTRISTVCCVNMYPRKDQWQQLKWRKLQ
jgi:hypothetical protein